MVGASIVSWYMAAVHYLRRPVPPKAGAAQVPLYPKLGDLETSEQRRKAGVYVVPSNALTIRRSLKIDFSDLSRPGASAATHFCKTLREVF